MVKNLLEKWSINLYTGIKVKSSFISILIVASLKGFLMAFSDSDNFNSLEF